MRRISLLASFIILAAALVFAQSSDKSKATDNKKSKVDAKTPNAVFLDVNPHITMFKDSKINNEICLLCHSVKHISEPKITGSQEYITAEVNELCANCHTLNPHVGAAIHLVKPDKSMMKRIRAWEKKNKKKLRFGKKEQITCSTCHSPHPKGLLAAVSKDVYKDITEPMKKYSEIAKDSPLYKGNLESFKKYGLFKKDPQSEVNSIDLPFRFPL
jgi:hypothetical protein